MKIKLDSAQGKPGAGFRSVIDVAAQQAGISDDQMLLYMTHFVESLATEVARGGIVTIPGFGKFAAVYLQHFRNQPHTMRPRFLPAVGFVQQTKLCAPVSTAGNKALFYYIKNHHVSTKRPNATVAKAMTRIRESIRNQMAQD